MIQFNFSILQLSKIFPLPSLLTTAPHIAAQAVKKQINALKSQGVVLDKNIMMPLLRHPTCMSNTFECVQHGQSCKCRPADFHIGGFPCISYSPQGLRRLDKGDDFPHWCCWAAQRRSLEDSSRCWFPGGKCCCCIVVPLYQ